MTPIPYLKNLLKLNKMTVFIIIGYLSVIMYTAYLLNKPKLNTTPTQTGQQYQKKTSAKSANGIKFSTNIFGTEQKDIQSYKPKNWKLTGIIHKKNGETVAIIMIGNKEKTFAVNDKIDSQTKIHSIEKEKVLLKHQQKIKSLSLFKKKIAKFFPKSLKQKQT